MKDFWNRPLDTSEMIVIAAACILFILALLWWSGKRSRRIAADFLEKYPTAAVLYLTINGIPNHSGKVVSKRGTVSLIFSAKDAPKYGVANGVACYIAPGFVELDASVSWTDDYYVVKRHKELREHLSF